MQEVSTPSPWPSGIAHAYELTGQPASQPASQMCIARYCCLPARGGCRCPAHPALYYHTLRRFVGNTSVALVTHGLALRLFLMRWLHWTVDDFL
jgi:hypothetical protein